MFNDPLSCLRTSHSTLSEESLLVSRTSVAVQDLAHNGNASTTASSWDVSGHVVHASLNECGANRSNGGPKGKTSVASMLLTKLDGSRCRCHRLIVYGCHGIYTKGRYDQRIAAVTVFCNSSDVGNGSVLRGVTNSRIPIGSCRTQKELGISLLILALRRSSIAIASYGCSLRDA